MEREAALALLTDMVAATSRPVLSPETVSAILDQNRTVDDEGRLATDMGWDGTWDLNSAAAAGWRLKAGKVAGDFNFSADGASYSKADVLAHCLAMADQYGARTAGVTRTLEARNAARLPDGWDGNQVP